MLCGGKGLPAPALRVRCAVAPSVDTGSQRCPQNGKSNWTRHEAGELWSLLVEPWLVSALCRSDGHQSHTTEIPLPDLLFCVRVLF